jgi:hypothetical protein
MPRAFEAATDARWLARSGANPDCGAGTIPIDYDRLLAGTDFDPRMGQSPAAFAAGRSFEKACAGVSNSYAPLLTALAEKGLDTGNGGIEIFPDSLSDQERAQRTRRRLRLICSGDRSVVLILQAVLGFDFAGHVTYIRPDAVALVPVADRLFVAEMKSFRLRDGHYPAGKIATALEQTAVYQVALRRILIELHLDPALISDEGVIVCARNLGMEPVATRHDNGHRVATLEQRIARAEARLRAAPDPRPLMAGTDSGTSAADRLAAFVAIVDTYGVAYKPSCLVNCGAAFWCRADAADDPARLGNTRLLAPAASLRLADAWSHGTAPAGPAQAQVAAHLAGVRRLVDAARADSGLPVPRPARLRRAAAP